MRADLTFQMLPGSFRPISMHVADEMGKCAVPQAIMTGQAYYPGLRQVGSFIRNRKYLQVGNMLNDSASTSSWMPVERRNRGFGERFENDITSRRNMQSTNHS